jgi:predicted nucleic acid-binding protein
MAPRSTRQSKSTALTAVATSAAAPPLMRVLIDTNVLLDVILAREPWVDDAAHLLDAVARREIDGFVASHAITTIFYLVERERDRHVALSAISDLLSVVSVASVGAADLHRAMTLALKDFEDAVHVAACLQIGGHFLVTRNTRDYRGGPVTTRTASEILALLGRERAGEAEQ